MNLIKHFYLLLILLVGSTSNIQAQQEYPLLDTIVTSFLETANLPGISIAVSQDEQLIYAEGYGYADLENNIPMTPDMQLRTASVAKVITTTALGKLLSEGKIDLDAPIKTYVPYIDKQYAQLTLRQLTGHTSGMAHRPKGNAYKKKQYTSIQESTQLLKAPLLFEPDTQYQYSTHAFNLVAAAIEGASGTSFETYLKEDVFNVLGMQHTFPENIKQLSEKDAQLYYHKKGKLHKEKLTNASYKLAGAGFRSTPTDLVKMMHGYTNGFISSEAKKTLFKSHQLIDGSTTQVGITWRSSIDIFGHNVIEHAGSWRGTRTVIVHYPKDNLNIAIMINADSQIIIEETAHLLAYIIRNNASAVTSSLDIDKNISVTARLNNEITKHSGTFRFQENQGLLTVADLNFISSAPILYIGKQHYVAITKAGILYLQMTETENIQGNLFIYHTRHKTTPLEHTPLISFQ
ncbi:serine hydrolase domain-containing protein [uncultured Dokdonia sp.]|uniref:serine hydrolase domain-containing protein n=1 Tax=uncultured Dokdonia sp. TaxID=575653 RepID=UPI002630BCCC|nr:serine hydrolase domain-containing protein [uncultured Dokdonia sp.]